MASHEGSHVIEQDFNVPSTGDELPTYDDLAAQSGPNSRFGRWRGWIEKRAAERYMDITPEEHARRRTRGWGGEEDDFGGVLPVIIEPPLPSPRHLHIQTDTSLFSPSSTPDLSRPLPPLPLVSQKLPPTHLKLNQFGSRFLPHTTSPIRCLLPLLSDRLLLIGHDEGLSVLDMFPQEWTDTGLARKGPDEAQARLIWEGEGVYQMTILEVENTGEDTPQGVVLALVGPESEHSSNKDQEPLRTLRMYNLASLTSLAKWAIAQKGARPLDLRRPSNWNAQQSPVKKHHRTQNSITRGLKSLIIDSPNSNQMAEPVGSSYYTLLSPSASIGPIVPSSNSRSSSGRSTTSRASTTDEWDVVEDLPLRWATDFVPLASAGSRLTNTSVYSYAIWRDEDRRGKTGQLLAIAIKSNILLYETPRGERAFHFVKEFYTPLQPRTITFFQQSVQEISRSQSSPSRFPSARSEGNGVARADLRTSPTPPANIDYGTQLSIFVIFDKRAGWIRLADSAVGEIDLLDESTMTSQHTQQHSPRDSLSPSSFKKNRSSFDGHVGTGKWIPPTPCELPVPPSHNHPLSTTRVHLITRGKHTHILPYPLPVQVSMCEPLRIVTWKAAPASVTPRVSNPALFNKDGLYPYLQLVALGDDGVEVQEISLSFLIKGKGKGKARLDDSLWADSDVGGTAGFLCTGGHWDHPTYPQSQYEPPPLSRASSTMTDTSFSSVSTDDLAMRLKSEEGIYGWCKKGHQDYRVFWVGGSLMDEVDSDLDDS